MIEGATEGYTIAFILCCLVLIWGCIVFLAFIAELSKFMAGGNNRTRGRDRFGDSGEA
jgi:hypothetical protein